MSNTVYYEDDYQRDRNRKGLLLAQTRFSAQIKPFIEGKPDRLNYVRSEINRIVTECSAETKADESYVAQRLEQFVADAVAVTEPEHMDLEGNREESLPPEKNDPSVKNPEPDAETSVLDHGTVLEDEILEPDAKIDLNDDTAKASCFRCGNELNVVVAKLSKVCPSCTSELSKLADVAPLVPNSQGMSPANPNQLVQCDWCASKGYHFEGTPDQVQQHIQTQHQAEMQQQQMQQFQQPAAKTADQEDMTPPNPAPDTVKADEGISDQANPVHHFDDAVQDMADHAAAVQFSTPSDEEVQKIAEQYGSDPETIKSKLITRANFGQYTAVDGQLTQADETVPDGYTEVDLEGMGGAVQSHNAQVPVSIAVGKVSKDLGVEEDLVYNMLKDAYGDSLGDQYTASVQGDHRFYLPNDMVPEQKEEPPAAQPTPQQQQQIGPTPQPVSSIRELVELDRRRAQLSLQSR